MPPQETYLLWSNMNFYWRIHAATSAFFMIFGHTDLRKSVSGAQFDAEFDFEVRLAVAPSKSIENNEKLNSKTEKKSFFCFFYVFGTAKGRSRLKC